MNLNVSGSFVFSIHLFEVVEVVRAFRIHASVEGEMFAFFSLERGHWSSEGIIVSEMRSGFGQRGT